MLRFLGIFFLYIFFITPSFADKIFKSKNGYYFLIPNNHKVVERDMSKLYEKYKNTEVTENLDQEMLKESSGVNIRYLTWIIDKKEKEPEKYNISITASKEILLKPSEFVKELCPSFNEIFDQMLINKKVNLYTCEKQNLINNKANLEVLKFVYDSLLPDTLMHHYMTVINDHIINFAGICLKGHCSNLEQNLVYISSSFKWN